MLTPPSKGTPIDLEFIGLLTTQVNNIENALRGDTVSNSVIGSTSEKTFGKVVFYANSQTITPGTVDTSSRVPFHETFSVAFKTAPYVVVSITNKGRTQGGDYVSAVLNNVTKDGCDGVLTFGKADNPTLEITVIAIGIAE